MLHLALMALLVADEAGIDALRSAWQFKRRVTTSGDDALASLTLPPDLSANAAPQGRDLRLIDLQGREIPYLLDWTSEREGLAAWRANLKDVRREKESDRATSAVRSAWTIDLGALRTFTELALNVPEVAFSWHVRIETSKNGTDYELAQSDAPLFDQTWNGERVRKTEVRFDAPVAARYVRVIARSASESNTFELLGALGDPAPSDQRRPMVEGNDGRPGRHPAPHGHHPIPSERIVAAAF